MAVTRAIGVVLLALAACLAACAPLSQEIRREAQASAPFSEIRKDPEKFRGSVVVWGGVIIETVNRQDSTAIRVLQTALDFQGRPTDLDRSEGRFIVVVDRFLDPDIFKKGRELTVGGEIAGSETHPIGEVLFVHPVVRARELKLWEQRVESPPHFCDPWFWGPPCPWGPWRRHPYWW